MRDHNPNHHSSEWVQSQVLALLEQAWRNNGRQQLWMSLRTVAQALHLEKRTVREAMDNLTWRVHGTVEEALIATGTGGECAAVMRMPGRHHVWRFVPAGEWGRDRMIRGAIDASRQLRAGTTRPGDGRPPRGPYGKTRP